MHFQGCTATIRVCRVQRISRRPRRSGRPIAGRFRRNARSWPSRVVVRRSVAERCNCCRLRTGPPLREWRAGCGDPNDCGPLARSAKSLVLVSERRDAGEPNALARFAERSVTSALAESSAPSRNLVLLQAFGFFAAAAERAQYEDWPDDAWSKWRYSRATLARLLAREGMMQEVADAYTAIRAQWNPLPPTLWQRIEAKYRD